MSSPRKYDSLNKWLLEQADKHKTIIQLTFQEVAELIGETRLPDSAYQYQPWWGNDRSHSQALSWLDAGWEVKADLVIQLVTFHRV